MNPLTSDKAAAAGSARPAGHADATGYRTHADLGGQLGAGPIAVHEPEGQAFHAPWEPRALALTLALGATGQWNIDISRAARETLPDYAGLSYFQIWLAALERLMLQRGLVQADELAAAQCLHPALPLARVLHAADVAAVLARGSATQRPTTLPARFAVGDAVRMRDGAAPHHTRRPAYTWGKTGSVVRLQGMHVFADSHAQGLGEQPQWLYGVQFSARALWGDTAEASATVTLDAWDSYLDPAPVPAPASA